MKHDLFLISGASTGIGRALVEHFAEQGHHVLAGVRSAKDVDQFKSRPNVTPFFLDVTKSDDLNAVPDLIAAKLKPEARLILINNAGIAVHGPWELVSEPDLRRQIDINVLGPILLTKKCLPALRKTKGHVFNMSSISGLFASPFLGPYSTSKFALDAFSDSLRREMIKFGVSVTSINPGPIRTPIWQKGFDNPNREEFQQDPVYGHLLKRFETNVKKAADEAIDVNAVVQAVDQAYRSKMPTLRVIVGTMSTRIFIRLTQFLPSRWVDHLLRRW
jgi:NAD(P)-dependent dehydrogenase (short-subunit alcohol dehydrogenase family)